MKRSYHSDVIISFQLGVLQPDILQQVPSSTLHNWKHRDLAKLVGTKQCLINEQYIRMVKDFLKHKQALKFAKAAYLAFRILKTLTHASNAFRKWAMNNKKFLVEKIQHLVLYLPLNKSLKLFDISPQAYHRWKNQVNCENSLMRLCRKTHPFQLCSSEVANIKKYLSDKSLLHWPVASIYYHMLRQATGYMSLATFYKYSRCMLDKGMVEALNKRLKYHFIFHHTVNDEEHALQVVRNAVNDYHRQPLRVLHGLTALEVLKGKIPDKRRFSDKIKEAT